MKTNKYQKRFYRDWVKAKGLYPIDIREKEADLQFYTDKKIDREYLLERVRLYRWQIESYIAKEKRFLTSLKPISVELNAAPIIKVMAEAANKANVGPMAAVAGAIAEFLGKDLLKQGCKEVIIENGGDIFFKCSKARHIGIYAGKSKLWQKVRLKINSANKPLGICASSGTLGHSLSFGKADSVVILAKKAALADAVATAAANRVQNKETMKEALNFARSIPGVLGAVIIIDDHLMGWGNFEFVN